MTSIKYLQAKKRVAKQKSFYNHLQVFIIIMVLLFFFSNMIFNFFESYIQNPNTLKWAKANIWVNALLWAIGLLIHGLFAFNVKNAFLKNWEKKKITEFMNQKE
ncbi:MAG: 2TM domain-containing protein [Tenacibaculum sp.]